MDGCNQARKIHHRKKRKSSLSITREWCCFCFRTQRIRSSPLDIEFYWCFRKNIGKEMYWSKSIISFEPKQKKFEFSFSKDSMHIPVNIIWIPAAIRLPNRVDRRSKHDEYDNWRESIIEEKQKENFFFLPNECKALLEREVFQCNSFHRHVGWNPKDWIESDSIHHPNA